MNIKIQGFNLVSNYGLKSTQDRLERQFKRDSKVAFFAPKTAEERIEDMIEEATGTEENEGMMTEMLEEISDAADEMQETLEENMEKTTEALEENLSEMIAESELVSDGASVSILNDGTMIEDDGNLLTYKRIDILI